MKYLQDAFEEAKKAYPSVYVSGYKKAWEPSLFDDEEEEEIEVAHTWQLVDAVGASFYAPEREGKLLLQEHRPGCAQPFNHWGFMVPKSEVIPSCEPMWDSQCSSNASKRFLKVL